MSRGRQADQRRKEGHPPMKKRSYRSEEIKRVTPVELSRGSGEVRVFAVDVAKRKFMMAVLDGAGEVLRIVRWTHPEECRAFLSLASGLVSLGHRVEVVMEPTGTYGDALRWQLDELGIAVYRVSTKRVRDAREVFDGVPSSHDAKAATVIGRLHQQGLSELWKWKQEAERALRALADQLAVYDQQEQAGMKRLEAHLARFWPELDGLLGLASRTAVELLRCYGGPRAVALAPEEARALMQRVSSGALKLAKIETILESARQTVGVEMIPAEIELIQAFCEEIAHQRERSRPLEKRLATLLDSHPSGAPLAAAFGAGTAAVLLTRVGDPRDYSCARSYEKAMGLNLRENSSGEHRGRTTITRRGSGAARAYLYLAAMRQVNHNEVVRAWYDKKVRRDGGARMRALVAVMRKLARALWHVGRGATFDTSKLFDTAKLEIAAAEAK